MPYNMGTAARTRTLLAVDEQRHIPHVLARRGEVGHHLLGSGAQPTTRLAAHPATAVVVHEHQLVVEHVGAVARSLVTVREQVALITRREVDRSR